jgi:hypothetical protein
LGEKARELRAKTSQQGNKPAKVYTNDDIHSGSGDISVLGDRSSTAPSSAPVEPTTEEHNEQFYRRSMNELQARLDLHQRQLEVLKQKLAINQMQYYPDPYKTLQQEYSRSDIGKLQQEIDAKTAEVQADEQAIANLQAQLRREGGDPGWLRPTSGRPAEKQRAAGGESKEAGETPLGKPGTREYWQSRFKSARAKVAEAQEKQQLAEDELNLLQVQQAREPNGAELGQKIPAKQAEVESARAATHDAELALEALQREFAASGSPEEWGTER